MVYMPYNTKIQLAWLAGILDGEGSFMVIRSNRKGKYRYFYRISIANSNEIIINECKLILKRLGIKCCCYFQDRRGIKTIRRQTYLIHITNRDGIIKLCSAVVCYLIGKKRLGKRLLYIVTNWKKQNNKEHIYQEFKLANKRVPKAIKSREDIARAMVKIIEADSKSLR